MRVHQEFTTGNVDRFKPRRSKCPIFEDSGRQIQLMVWFLGAEVLNIRYFGKSTAGA